MLVHLATGPENPSRAALALLVARTAVEEGHSVQVFLAADAVQLVRPETAAAVHGVGTGSFAEHWDARGGQVEGAPPQKLVELAVWAETTLTY